MTSPSPRVAPLLLALALGNGLGAQQTWNVTTASGLFAAAASAAHGDTIALAPGFYNVGQGLVLDRGIALLGAPGTTLHGAGGGPVLTVRSIPADQRFVLRDLAVQMAGAASWAVLFDANTGSVHVDNCQFANHSNTFSVTDMVWLQDCRSVSFADCTTTRMTVYLVASNVHFSRCTLSALEAWPVNSSYGRAAGLGLFAQSNSEVTLSRCSVAGGAALGQFPGGTAVAAIVGTRVTIAGDARDVYRVGSGTSSTPGHSAIDLLGGSTLSIASQVTLMPAPGVAAISGPFTTSPRPIAVTVQAGPPGGTAVTTVITDAGESALAFAGITNAPTVVSPFGTAWMRAAPVFVLGTGVVAANGEWRHASPIPAVPSLRAIPITVQALCWSATAPLRLSVPATMSVD